MSEQNGIRPGGTNFFLNHDQWKECARRVLRANISSDLPVRVRMPDLSPNPLPVRTIGELGAYCVSQCNGLAVNRDHVQVIELTLADERFELEGRVRYILADGVAIEFHNPSENIRNKIKALFGPEFLAKSLVPIVTYAGTEPGSAWTLIYSDGESNSLQISLANGTRINALTLDLAILETRAAWSRNSPLSMATFFGAPVAPKTRARIVGFCRNLQNLDPEVLHGLEWLFTHGRPAPTAK